MGVDLQMSSQTSLRRGYLSDLVPQVRAIEMAESRKPLFVEATFLTRRPRQ